MPKQMMQRRTGSKPDDAARSPAADQPGIAARDVTPGTSWVFAEHRTMQEVIAQEKTKTG